MVKIAIVNDSLVAAESLRRVINSVPAYELVWMAHDGLEAVDKCASACPDIILMDLIMPVMDGIEATRRIAAEFDCAILVVTATVSGLAGRVFEAMGAGALDAVNTPILGPSGHGEGREVLIQKINTIATLIHGKPLRSRHTAHSPRTPQKDSGPPLIAIGASTGGPSAIREILRAMPAHPGVAIAIVQHVDEQFMPSFINWLNESTPLPLRAAKPGDRLAADTVFVCGRQDHLIVTPDGALDYTPEPTELVYRPSVDVFFDSIAENLQNQTIGVLLTGMGKDGAAGLKSLRERGCLTVAQDQDTSAVYGMPKAAKELDAAGKILPLGEIGPALVEWADQVVAEAREQRKSG
ncbi:MAG: chemotaxis-specific protein-glutamate methyltransferase CheB [Thiogranum sp.]|nr:chemotaxis-specific protein-glutamate methyltransferase CheB [Thiogranum sp.]